MKKMFACSITIVIILIMISCSREEGLIDLRFSLVQSYHLPVPVGAKANSWFQKFYENGKHRNLFVLNDDEQKMYIYDIDKGVVDDSFDFIEDGPGAPGEVLGFTVVSQDKIALSSGMRPYSLIIDRNNNVLDTLNYFVSGDQEPGYLRMGARDYVDFAFGDDKHFFIQRPFYRGIHNRPSTIEHHPIIIHDVDKGANRYHPFKFPKEYWQKGLDAKMNFNHDDDYAYFSMAASHEVYRIDRKSEAIDTFYIKSGFAPEKMPGQLDFSGPEDVMLYDASTVRYTAIIPDPYRNLTYRLATLPPSDPQTSINKFYQLHMYPDRFSLIICDAEMSVVGEHVFPEQTYFPHGIFVSREGVHVPAAHPEYLVSNGMEDSVRYDVFVPKFK